MFWRRKANEDPDPGAGGAPEDEAPVTDAEIEAQLDAELADAELVDAELAPADLADADPEPIIDGDLDAGVARSRGGFMARLRGILRLGDADAATWEEVEEILIAGDVGAALAIDVVERARARRHPAGPEAAVREELAALLAPREPGWSFQPAAPGQPAVVLVVGVNGTGKTTTIGKIAARERAAGCTVLLAAGDTFRAAAIEQLRLWGQRAGASVVAHAPGADPAAVIYDALDAAVARGVDILIADTAGRLHTKSNLMDELAKMRRVIDRRLPGCRPEAHRDRPHEARLDRQGRNRLRHRARPLRAGPVRGGGREGGRPPAVRSRRVRGGTLRVGPSAGGRPPVMR
jgi:fused signal recognition particle receptor